MVRAEPEKERGRLMFGLEDDLYCSIDALNEKIAELEAEVGFLNELLPKGDKFYAQNKMFDIAANIEEFYVSPYRYKLLKTSNKDGVITIDLVQHFEYGEPTNITRSLGWLILKTKQAKEKSNDTK